ncbi:MAG: hypothetical protein U5L02_04835 [Rheinheimera sp.]|nr:hypothetical protein [Rheinheimera sp.]
MDYLQDKIKAIQLVKQRSVLQQQFQQLLQHEPYRWGAMLVADRMVLSSAGAPSRFNTSLLQQQLGVDQLSSHTPKMYPARQTAADA